MCFEIKEFNRVNNMFISIPRNSQGTPKPCVLNASDSSIANINAKFLKKTACLPEGRSVNSLQMALDLHAYSSSSIACSHCVACGDSIACFSLVGTTGSRLLESKFMNAKGRT